LITASTEASVLHYVPPSLIWKPYDIVR